MNGEGTSTNYPNGERSGATTAVLTSDDDGRRHRVERLAVGEAALVPLRRTSCSSNTSSPARCTTPDYDSGHYSGSNTSDLMFQPELLRCGFDDDGHTANDVRVMLSEIERLAKSERWYKNELKVQKRSKLDLLEKLYMNERKFMRENQKLQADCKRLYALCNEVDEKKTQEKEQLMKRLHYLESQLEASKDKTTERLPGFEALQFELQRQTTNANENENLIQTLRAQKRKLLEELRSLAHDRDTKILEIEKKTISLECENRSITKRYLELAKEKSQLSSRLEKSLEDSEQTTNYRQLCQRQLTEINRLGSTLADQKIANEIEINHLKAQLESSRVKAKEYSENAVQLGATCAEKQLQNDHLVAEIEQYKIMRENYDKYVALLQGSSAELHSKCAEIQHVQSVVDIQKQQLAELNKNLQDTKDHWHRVTGDLKAQLDAKNRELNESAQNLRDMDVKRSAEIGKLRDRLGQLEGLNEKLLGQLRHNSAEIMKKSSEIEQLKTNVRDLNELNVENEQLKRLLDAKEDELNQRRVHEAFIGELQTELQQLKDDLSRERLDRKKTEALRERCEKLEGTLKTKDLEFYALRQSLCAAQQENASLDSKFQEKVVELRGAQQVLETSNSELQATVQLQSNAVNNLKAENEQLKGQVTDYAVSLRACRTLLTQYEATTSHPNNALLQLAVAQPEKDIQQQRHVEIQLLRETSQNVPEICDSDSGRSNNNTADVLNSLDCPLNPHQNTLESAEIHDLKLLLRVVGAEHRKRIARYELHIRTLLGKLRSYRNRESAQKSREVLACEKQVESLRCQLRQALRRNTEIEHYKRQNLYLTSNLKSLTDDYKRMLLSTKLSPASNNNQHRYDDINKLIETSNNFVPNIDQLTNSIDALKEDISQLKVVLDPVTPVPPSDCSTPKTLHNSVKRLSLMDELMAADESFTF